MTAWLTPSSVRPHASSLLKIGRHRELAMLRDHLGALLAGRGGLVLIGGEEGIGKTTIATAACREATAAGVLILSGHCYDRTADLPYGLWRDLIERYPDGEDCPPLPSPLPDRGIALPGCQDANFAALGTFLPALARERPLLLLLEDLHWADLASIELLRATARHLDTMPLLIVCTYRPEALARDHPLHIRLPALVREAAATRLDLAALSKEELNELVAARYALSNAETRQLAAYLHQRTDGVSLFVTELLRAAEEEGHLRETHDGWQLGSLPSVGVPPLLRQVLDGRLRHLSPKDRHLLEMASVIGQEVPLDLWATVAGVAEADLLDTIERSEALYLLTGSHDGARVRFVHALLRDACYEGTSAARRRSWHRQIAEAMSQLHQCDPDAVANQFRQAGDVRATEWLIRAGDYAYRARTYAEALERYEATAKLLSKDGPEVERAWLRYRLARTYHHLDPGHARVELDETYRLATAAGDRALAAVARYHQGEEWFLAGEYEAGLERMATGVEALEGLLPEEQASLTAHADLTGLAHVSNARGVLIAGQAMLGHFPAAVAAAERWDFPPAVPNPGDYRGDHQGAYGYFGLGQWRAAIGQPGEARKLLAQARDLCSVQGLSYQFGFIAAFELSQVLLPFYADQRPVRQQLGTEIERAWRQADEFGHTPSPAVFRAPFLAADGDWAGALALANATLADKRLGNAHLQARSLLCRLARDQGDVGLAWRQIREALPGGPDTAPGTLPIAVALDLLHLAAALALDVGDPQAARPWLNAAARWLAWSGVVRWQAEQQLLWGRYHQVAGDITRAYHVAAEAIARASEPRQPLALLAAHRFLGELAIALGRTRDAATHLAAARPLAEACALPHEHALTLLSLAELSVAEGRRDAASTPLAEARRIAVALRAAPAVTRADALATRLAGPESTPQPAGLSLRELEVLRLLARGATNRAIAEDLYLSERHRAGACAPHPDQDRHRQSRCGDRIRDPAWPSPEAQRLSPCHAARFELELARVPLRVTAALDQPRSHTLERAKRIWTSRSSEFSPICCPTR